MIGVFCLILAGCGVIVAFLLKWVEKKEVEARVASIPRPRNPDGELIVPLSEDTLDEGGEREYRRADGEYRKGQVGAE